MGSLERREREKLQQRQNILDAALEIISKEGFAALSMRKLADRIEYSPASIYLYFKNREQIAQELCERGFQQLIDMLMLAVSGKQGAEALYALGPAYVRFGLQHPQIYRLIFMGDSEYMTAAYAENRVDSAASRAYGLLFEVAQQLKNAGGAKEDVELSTIVDLILSTLHGIVSLQITCSAAQVSSPEMLVRFAIETLVNGLKNGSEKAAPCC